MAARNAGPASAAPATLRRAQPQRSGRVGPAAGHGRQVGLDTRQKSGRDEMRHDDVREGIGRDRCGLQGGVVEACRGLAWRSCPLSRSVRAPSSSASSIRSGPLIVGRAHDRRRRQELGALQPPVQQSCGSAHGRGHPGYPWRPRCSFCGRRWAGLGLGGHCRANEQGGINVRRMAHHLAGKLTRASTLTH